MPFIINEDEALKQHLSGMTVADTNDATRQVKVYFRLPESEERRKSYPFVTIELIDIEREADREHRGKIIPQYVPEGYTNPIPGSDAKADFPTPVSLVYQITTYARSAWHDRALMAQIYGSKLPLRFGHLDVPADETIRRLDFIDMQNMDRLDADNKREFRKAYTVTVSAELFLSDLESAEVVQTVDIDLFHKLYDTYPAVAEPPA